MSQTPRGIGISEVSALEIKTEFKETGTVSMRDYAGSYGLPGYKEPLAYSEFRGTIGLRVGKYTAGDVWGYNHPQVEGESIGSLHAGTSVTALSGENLLLYACLEYDLKSSWIYVIVLLGAHPANQTVLLSINGSPQITTVQYSQNATFSYYIGTTGQGTSLLASYKDRDVRITLELGTAVLQGEEV